MNKQDFGEVMEMLGGAFGSKFAQADPSVAKIWYECLKDLQSEWLKKAAIQWIQENKYPPSIAELRDIAKKIEQNEYEQGNVERWQ
ncbi:replicative helicase loader/inhibitor [Lacrimispora sp.]|uniref:replicative helicase loader/inhibitor n=1 Tax=Lacrimispora sp. TaxID=2719234 RepID=UPI003992A632